MSAIKKFFEKKKREAKFKMAGPGQKLGDAESAAAQRATREAAAAAAASRQGASTSRSGHLQRPILLLLQHQGCPTMLSTREFHGASDGCSAKGDLSLSRSLLRTVSFPVITFSSKPIDDTVKRLP